MREKDKEARRNLKKKTTRTESKLKQASENKISRSRRRTKLGNLKNPKRRKTFKAKTVKTGSTRRQGPRRETQGPRREAGEKTRKTVKTGSTRRQGRRDAVASTRSRRRCGRQSRQAQQGGRSLDEKKTVKTGSTGRRGPQREAAKTRNTRAREGRILKIRRNSREAGEGKKQVKEDGRHQQGDEKQGRSEKDEAQEKSKRRATKGKS